MKRAKEPIVVIGTLRSTAGAMVSSRWNLVLRLSPWQRAGDAEPIADELRVEIPASHDTIRRTPFKNHGTVRVRLDQLDAPAAKARKAGWLPRGWVGHGRFPVSHLKATASRKSLDRPVVINDARLGRLRLQRASNLYDGFVRLGGRKCELSVAQSGSGDDRARRDISRAGTLIAKLETSVPKILDAVVRKCLPLYNQEWRGDRPALDADTLRGRLKPTSVTVNSDGSANALLAAGDLFADHVIEVRFKKSGAISEVCLAG